MNTYSSAPDLQILKKVPILRAQKIWKLHILIFELLKERKIRLLQITGALPKEVLLNSKCPCVLMNTVLF